MRRKLGKLFSFAECPCYDRGFANGEHEHSCEAWKDAQKRFGIEQIVFELLDWEHNAKKVQIWLELKATNPTICEKIIEYATVIYTLEETTNDT
jgi:hypothetical protein